MDDPGQKFKRARERLGLRYRDVEEFSVQIAERRKNSEFTLAISRLSDIENRGAIPSLYKLYSLCVIYRLEMAEVMRWYGIDPTWLASDAVSVGGPDKTHIIGFGKESLSKRMMGEIQVPLSLDPGVDLAKTTFLTRFIQSWGVLPLMLAGNYDPGNYRYAWIGEEDWFMYPMLQPGSLILVDDTMRRIATGGWSSELDRPLYFLEHRDGWACGWCSIANETLVVLPHPASGAEPMIFDYASDVEVVGQVVGVANRLTRVARPRIRS